MRWKELKGEQVMDSNDNKKNPDIIKQRLGRQVRGRECITGAGIGMLGKEVMK